MANQWDSTDDDNGDGAQNDNSNSGGGLRKQLQEALAALKTLKDENGTLKAQARQASVSSVLKEKGYSEKVAKLIPADVEPTADAVQRWLDEYGDVFSVQRVDGGTAASAGDGDDGSDSADGVDPAEAMAYIQAMRQMGSVNGGAVSPEKTKDLLSKINDPNLKQEDLIKLIEAHGGGAGVG